MSSKRDWKEVIFFLVLIFMVNFPLLDLVYSLSVYDPLVVLFTLDFYILGSLTTIGMLGIFILFYLDGITKILLLQETRQNKHRSRKR